MRVFTATGAAVLCTVGLLAGGPAFAQQGPPPASTHPPTITSVLDTQLTIIEREFTGAAQAMPEDKYSFAPTNGEFKGVRTFAQQVKHVATVNNRFYGSILGETAPAAPDEGIGSNGPDAIQTKEQILQYLHESFAHAHKAIATLTPANAFEVIKSPEPGFQTRATLASFGISHCWDHYGQMVEYLRMNGIVPPASAK